MQNKDIISIGIDPSLTGTGVVVIKGDNILHAETIKTDSKKDMITRVSEIKQQVNTIITNTLSKVSKDSKVIVAIEGFSFGSRGRAVFDIGYLGWRIREEINFLKHLYQFMGFEWILVPPTSLKKFTTGKGNANKDVVMLNIYKRWDVEFADNNQADAFGLAQIGKAYLDNTENLLAFQEETIKALKEMIGND